EGGAADRAQDAAFQNLADLRSGVRRGKRGVSARVAFAGRTTAEKYRRGSGQGGCRRWRGERVTAEKAFHLDGCRAGGGDRVLPVGVAALAIAGAAGDALKDGGSG